MITINENRKRLVGEVYDYVHGLVDKSIKNDWKIVIWGFGRGGKFLRHLIHDIDGRAKVSFIIDEKIRFSYDSEPAIYRSSLLNYIDSSKHMIVSTIKEFNQIQEKLLNYSYHMGENLFDVYSDIGDSYIEYLQRKNSIIEFGNVLKENMDNDFGNEYVEHVPFGYSCVDHVFSEISGLDNNLAFFDYGCGKGAAILMAYMSGMAKLGGVEIERNIYNQCVINMKELGIDCTLSNEDAIKCKIDEYNCFFFYNPFLGTVFKKVLNNIQESFINYRRKVYLIYANPFEHKCIIEGGFFKLYKQIRTDLYDPLLNIYIIDDKFF